MPYLYIRGIVIQSRHFSLPLYEKLVRNTNLITEQCGSGFLDMRNKNVAVKYVFWTVAVADPGLVQISGSTTPGKTYGRQKQTYLILNWCCRLEAAKLASPQYHIGGRTMNLIMDGLYPGEIPVEKYASLEWNWHLGNQDKSVLWNFVNTNTGWHVCLGSTKSFPIMVSLIAL